MSDTQFKPAQRSMDAIRKDARAKAAEKKSEPAARYQSSENYPGHLWDTVEKCWVHRRHIVRIPYPPDHIYWERWNDKQRENWLQWRDAEERRILDVR